MHCKQARQQIDRLLQPTQASPELTQHTAQCSPCAKFLKERTVLHNAIDTLRAENAALGPSTHVEQQVLAALNATTFRPHSTKQPFRRITVSIVAFAALLIAAVLLFTVSHTDNVARIAQIEHEEPFTAMPCVVPPTPYERTTVIRTQVLLQIMQYAGFQVHEDIGSTTLADVLYGEDGRILALRLVTNPTLPLKKGSTDMRTSLLALIAAPLLTLPLVAQATYTSVAIQQPSWVGSPDWSAITVHVTQPDGKSGPVPNEPFSAIEVRHLQQVLADGAHIDHDDTMKFYCDTQGRMRVEGAKVIVLSDPTIDATYTLHLQEKTYDQYSAGGGKYSTSIAAYGHSNHVDTPGVSGPVQVVKWDQIPYQSEPVTHIDTVQLGLQPPRPLPL